MARKQRSNVHEIKFAKREYKVETCKDGRRLKRRKHWDTSSQAFFVLCIFLMITLSVYTVLESISRARGRNILDLDYGSVSVQPLEGEKYTSMSDYTAVDVFARLNWTFAHQEKWYSEMHGKVNTVIAQEVSTYKKFNNGILISADLTNSSLINNASEFCYLRDQDIVMWRKAAGGASTYNGFDTPWQEGDPYRTMTISGQDGFKATNGLPAYELSVYVIEEHTVESATPIVKGDDGLYTVTYTLVPNTWEEEGAGGALITKGATAYYANQMIFSGGLPEPPSFHSISYTVVFDEDWQVFRTDITENYDAKYGPIAANCIYTATTVYEYGTERAESSEFEDYFQNYADAPIDNGKPAEKVPTSLDCLAEAFGSVLTEPTAFDLDLSLNGNGYHGVVNVDLGGADISALDLGAIKAKAKVGPLDLWLDGGEAYLDYGGAKLKVNINDLIDLVKEYMEDEAGGEEQDLLGALGNGDFTYTETAAELHSVLPLGDFSLPVNFYFRLGDAITLDRVTASITLGETQIDLGLAYGSEQLPDLAEAERGGYAPLVPYADRLVRLFTSETLRARIGFSKDDLSLEGDLLVGLSPLTVQGTLKVSLGGVRKDVMVSCVDDCFYIDLDGIRLSATMDEVIELVKGYISLPESGEQGAFDLGGVLNHVLSDEVANLILTSAEEDRLTVSLRGTELLQKFGFDFALGDVNLTVSEEGLGAKLLGIEALISEGEPFEVETDGYTPVMKYVDDLIKLVKNQTLNIKVDYAGTGNFSAHGDITIDTQTLAATSEIEIGYGTAQKTVNVLFADGEIYLCVDGIKVSANVSAAAELLSEFVEIPKTDLDARKIVEKILSLDLGRLANITEKQDALIVALNGTELLQNLGLDFELGNVELQLSGETLKASALGADITITKGEEFTLDTNGYIELVGYAKNLKELLSSGYLNAAISYTGKLSVAGNLKFDMNKLVAQADLNLEYGEISKNVTVLYADKEIYLSVEGLKVKANIPDAIEFVQEFVEIPESDTDATELITKILGMNFADLLNLEEKDNTLQVTLYGTKLLEVLGLDFELGNVELSLNADSLKASALGANIEITKCDAFEINTDGYIELVGYAKNLKELLSSGYLNAAIKYDGTLKVAGDLKFDINKLVAQADLTLTYENIEKEVTILYADKEVYLSVEGLKVKANIPEAIDFVKEFVEIPESDTDANELITKLLSMDFEDLLKLDEKDNTLQVTIYGTKLLEVLGLDFELGNVELSLNADSLKASALGANIKVTKCDAFEINTDGYIELVGYAKNLKELLSSGYLNAAISYTGKLSVAGDLKFDINKLVARADLNLEYGEISKNVTILYADKEVYLSVEGLKVKANIPDAIEFVQEFVEIPETDVNANELITKILGMDFSTLLSMSESNDTLQVTLYGTKLLEVLGLDFELGNVELQLSGETLKASALGADITITKGEKFSLDTNGYIELVGYAKNLKELLSSGYLNAEIAYTGKLSVAGNLKFDMNKLVAQADLNLEYGEISKNITILYADKEIYLSVEGLKVKANIPEAIDFVKEFVEIPETDFNANELITKILGMNFADLLKLDEKDNTLQVTIYGTKLLEVLGLDFELGNVELQLSGETLKASALGADITITKGEKFSLDTNGYIELVGYAKNLKELLSSGYLNAAIKYDGTLKVAGNLKFDMNKLVAQADLTLTYENIEKEVTILYADKEVYLSVEGLKVKANIPDAIEFVQEFVEIPESDTDATELITKILGMNFADLLKLDEKDDTLQVTLYGTKLLEVLGLDFELGNVELSLNAESLRATALGADIEVTKCDAFEINTDGYIELVGYAKNLKELISSGYLNAAIKYDGTLKVAGNLKFDMNKLVAQADLTLTYENIEKEVTILYADKEVYLSVEGLKVKANIPDAIEFVQEFVEIPESDTDATELITKILGMNFADLLNLEEKDNTLQVTLYGTKLLEVLGLDFELGNVELSLNADSLKASALGADITITKGEKFSLDTDGYIELVGYAKNLKELLSSGYLNAAIKYDGTLKVAGNLKFDMNKLVAQADLTLTYENIEKEVTILYADKEVYLSVEGLKVKANIPEAVDFVKEFVEIPETDVNANELITKILGMDFSTLLSMSESNDTLQVTLYGTKLLEVLGLDFELGNVELQLGGEALKASALGANIEVTKCDAFEINTDGYIELVGYAKNLKELLSSGYLNAEVTYSKGELSVAANLQFCFKPLTARGTVALTYSGAQKEIAFFYADGALYLDVDGLKVSADVQKVAALFTDVSDAEEKSGVEPKEVILNLLGMNFEELLNLTETDDTLNLFVDGSLLLKGIGIDFDLGDVELSLNADSLKASALGANLKVTKCDPFAISEREKEGYIELSADIARVKSLLESNEFEVFVSYASDKISLEGTIDLSIGELKAQLKDLKNVDLKALLGGIRAKGQISLMSGEARKDISLIFADNILYLDIDGLKVSLNAGELIPDETKGGDTGDTLSTILNMNFGEYLTLARKEDKLCIDLKGTEFLKYFGSEFELGNVAVELGEDVSVRALGAALNISKSNPFVIGNEEIAGYIELNPYIHSLKDLLENDNFAVEISYSKDAFGAYGTLLFSAEEIKAQLREGNLDADALLDHIRAKADVTLKYEGFEKTVHIAYSGRAVYLEIDNLKIMTDLPSAQEAVAASLGAEDEESTFAIEKLLSLPYGELLELFLAKEGEESDRLGLIIHGTELLANFDSDFALGDMQILVGEDFVSIDALGAKLSLKGCGAFEIHTEGYRNLTEVAKKLVSIIKNQSITFAGEFTLSMKEEISLVVNRGYLSWADRSLALDIRGELVAFGANEHFTLRVLEGEDGYDIKLSLENLGILVETGKLQTLKDAFESLGARVNEVAGKIVGEDNLTHLSAIPGMETLASLSSGALGGETVLDALNAILGDFTMEELLDGITFGDADEADKLLALNFRGLNITLYDELEEDGMLKAALSYRKADSDLLIEAVLHADAAEGEFPKEADAGLCYLTIEHFAALLKQLEAAVGTIEQQNLNCDVSGSVVTDGETRYSVTGRITYSIAGDEVPFRLKKKAINVSDKLSLAIRLDVVATEKTSEGEKKDTSVYLDFWLLDYAPDGGTDGILDFYVSASTVGRPESGQTLDGYDPIKLYAPSSELMTVLSGALSVFGMDDIDLLNKYFITKWLPQEKNVKQFHALGDSLLSTLTQALGDKIAPVKDILQKLGAFAEENTTEAMGLMPASTGYIRSIETSENSFDLALNSDLLYHLDGLNDLKISMRRADGENGAFLGKIAVENIYNRAGNECTSLSLESSSEKLEVLKPEKPETFTSFEGVDKLLVALVNSATHEAEGDYKVNNNFYIDGRAGVSLNLLSLNLLEVNIDKIALSVDLDEDRKVAVNLHLEYQGVENWLANTLGSAVIINGDTVFDLTIKDGMAYMHRVQKSYYKEKKFLGLTTGHEEVNYSENDYEIIYRAMPLENFTGDIVNQLKFIFNFNDKIFEKILSMVGDNKSEDASSLDVGAQLDKYISDFKYENKDADSWILSLSGEGLTGSSAFSDIVLTLGADKDALIRSLKGKMDIVGIVDIDADLTWRNPAGKMDANVEDCTRNLQPVLEKGMQKKLENKVWSAGEYLEARGTKLSFRFNSKILSTQDVMYDAGTKQLLSALDLPDVKDIKNGYYGSWNIPETIDKNQSIDVTLTPRKYTIVFRSLRTAEDFTFNEGTGYFEKRIEWTYSETTNPELPLRADLQKHMTGFVCEKGELHTKEKNSWHVFEPDTLYLTAEWEDIVYTAKFVADGKTVSEVSGIYGDAIEHPENPSKDGYTFTGWEGDHATFGGEDYTITANFSPKEYTFRFISDYAAKDFAFDTQTNKWVREIKWTFDTELFELPTEENEARKLVGFRCENGDTHKDNNGLLHDFEDTEIELTAVWEDVIYRAEFKVDGEHYADAEGTFGSDIEYPDAPSREGYTFVKWSEEPKTFTQNYELDAEFVPNLYKVTFQSGSMVPGWELQNDNYTYVTEMYFGSEIEFKVGDTIKTETVRNEMTITLPDTSLKGRKGKWKEPAFEKDETAHTSSAKFETEYNPDHIIYKSEVTFTYENKTYTTLNADYNETYTLIVPTAANYEFLGWYKMENGSWSKVETLSLASAETTTTVEALWYAKGTLTVKASRTGIALNYHDMSASLSGNELKGAFASGASVTYHFTFILYKNSNSEIKRYETENSSGVTDNHRETTTKFTKGNKVTVTVDVTFKYNGQTVKSDSLTESVTF